MSYINENFLELQDSYLFSTIAKKVAKYIEENPDETAKILTETYDASQDEIASWLKDGAVQYNSTLQGVMNLSDFMVEENFLDKGASSIDELVFDNVKGE